MTNTSASEGQKENHCQKIIFYDFEIKTFLRTMENNY